jgi:hypothetical protein
MRCRSREGPAGSHQLEARREKCVTSVGSTEEEVVVVDEWRGYAGSRIRDAHCGRVEERVRMAERERMPLRGVRNGITVEGVVVGVTGCKGDLECEVPEVHARHRWLKLCARTLARNTGGFEGVCIRKLI